MMTGRGEGQGAVTLERAIEDYVRSRGSKHVSTAHALRAVRMVVPECRLGDRELSDMIARRAIIVGHAISFDHEERT